MISVRIGNDLPIEWTISRCGIPEDLSSKALAIYLTNRYGKYRISDYTIEGSTIQFVYPGREQKHTGEYGLLLMENSGSTGMYTVDVHRAFCLLSHTGSSCEHCEAVQLASDIAIPANGKSAYDIAVKYGFTGTEDEWLASLKDVNWEDMTDEQKNGISKGVLSAFHFLDVTSEWGYEGDFPGALELAVCNVRTSAVYMSFLHNGMRELWQFNGGEFSDAGNWRQFTGGIEEIPPAELDALIDEILTLNQ